jgi:hypothetical protein
MTTDTGTERPVPGWVRVAALVTGLAVAVVVGAVYLAGGFAQRTDRVSRSPGEEIAAGNLIFTLDRATAQRDDTDLGRGTWTVLVTGSVRNPHETSLRPMTGDRGNLLARDHSGGSVAVSSSTRLGDHYSRTEVPPDGRPLALVARFDFDSFDAGTGLDVAVATMEFTDNGVLGLSRGAKTWNPDSNALLQVVTVPLTVLPPKTS